MCYRSYAEKGHLKKHIQEVHEQIKPYQCPYCEKKCSRKPQVVQHVQAKHKIKITEESIIQMKEIIEVADNDKDWVQQTNIVNGDNFTEEDLGGFQLKFVSISRVINHMTCYRFECSH